MVNNEGSPEEIKASRATHDKNSSEAYFSTPIFLPTA
jgi:hypothetical protein